LKCDLHEHELRANFVIHPIAFAASEFRNYEHANRNVKRRYQPVCPALHDDVNTLQQRDDVDEGNLSQ
jgi:hypothetical protein